MLKELTPEQEVKLPLYRDMWINDFFNYRLQPTYEEVEKNMSDLYKFSGFSKPRVLLVDSPNECQVVARKETGVDAYHSFSSYGNYSDISWASFYYFFQEECGIKHKELNRVIQWAKSSYSSIQLEGLCIVSKFPTKILRNENNEMHSLEESAIKWKDGYELFFINGKAISKENFEAINNKTFNLSTFFNLSNEEDKSTCIEMIQLKYGDEYLYEFFAESLKIVDTFIDEKEDEYLEGTTRGMNVGVYTLFKGQINGENISYVRCYCPSTDRMFFLGVDNTHTNAKDAIASLYRVPKSLLKHIKYIQRQGERFSTVFTKEGARILEDLKNQSEIEYTTIPGDEYFSKMRYEF